MKNCPICRIIRGETKVRVLAETEHVIAFFHAAPINAGHALVVPRIHLNSVTTMPEATAADMMQTAARLGQALVRSTEGGGFNLHLANGDPAGQGFPHTHMHVIPRDGTDGFSWNWRNVEVDEAHLDALAEKVRRRLERESDES
jgi:histidine triad (HIT) family protein